MVVVEAECRPIWIRFKRLITVPNISFYEPGDEHSFYKSRKFRDQLDNYQILNKTVYSAVSSNWEFRTNLMVTPFTMSKLAVVASSNSAQDICFTDIFLLSPISSCESKEFAFSFFTTEKCLYASKF